MILNLMIHERQPETPYSKMRLQMPVVATPDKESTSTTASGRHKPITDKEKCQLLDLYIMKAKDPLEVVRRNPMKTFCKDIFDLLFQKVTLTHTQRAWSVWGYKT